MNAFPLKHLTTLSPKYNGSKKSPVSKISELSASSDLFLFAVSDNAIEGLAKELCDCCGYNLNVAHTSGMVSSQVFDKYFNDFGVFYPLQTFTKNRNLNMEEIPFFITCNGSDFENIIYNLAIIISNNVKFITDEERKVLHVTAVFVNNFTNYLYTISEDILNNENLNIESIYPLIKETAMKVIDGAKPFEIQTGPAIRNDKMTIEAHLKYLHKYPKYSNIYRALTEAIKTNKRL